MNKPRTEVAVFFAAGERRHHHASPLRRLRVIRRRPRLAARSTIAAAVRIFTRSSILHVAIGSGDAVLNPSRTGCEFVGLYHYAVRDDVRHYFIVPLSRWPGFGSVWSDRPINIPMSLASWLTFGLIPSHNCISVTRRFLSLGGVAVPRRITSPAALSRWLKEEGYAQHDL